MGHMISLTPQFRSVIDWLIKDVQPAAIVCFGQSILSSGRTGCFISHSSEHYHYDLLVVQPDTTGYKHHEIIDLITNRFPDGLSANVLSHSERSVSRALDQRNPFFTRVITEGNILYVADDCKFETPEQKGFSSREKRKIDLREYGRSFNLSDSFLELASDALGSKLHDAALFLLHQCVEQFCIASIKAHLQYRPTTHNIERLIGLVNCYLPEAKELFPCNTADERELFCFLKNAYSDVRYKMNYRVPPHIAFSIFERVTELKNIIDNKYKHEIEDTANEQLD